MLQGIQFLIPRLLAKCVPHMVLVDVRVPMLSLDCFWEKNVAAKIHKSTHGTRHGEEQLHSWSRSRWTLDEWKKEQEFNQEINSCRSTEGIIPNCLPGQGHTGVTRRWRIFGRPLLPWKWQELALQGRVWGSAEGKRGKHSHREWVWSRRRGSWCFISSMGFYPSGDWWLLPRNKR